MEVIENFNFKSKSKNQRWLEYVEKALLSNLNKKVFFTDSELEANGANVTARQWNPNSASWLKKYLRSRYGEDSYESARTSHKGNSGLIAIIYEKKQDKIKPYSHAYK